MSNTILCLGDSMTAQIAHNESYANHIHVPTGYTVQIEGVPWASLHHIREQRGQHIEALQEGDICILMGRAVFPHLLDDSVADAQDMLATAGALGTKTIFAPQPPWWSGGVDQQTEEDFACWNQMHQWCDQTETVYLDHWWYWAEQGFCHWPELYDADKVHMSICGAHHLARSVDWITRVVWGLV